MEINQDIPQRFRIRTQHIDINCARAKVLVVGDNRRVAKTGLDVSILVKTK